MGQATLHESLLFYFVHVRRTKQTERNRFFFSPCRNVGISLCLHYYLLSLHYKLPFFFLRGRCESRLTEPAVRLGPRPPGCCGTTKCRQSRPLSHVYIYCLFRNGMFLCVDFFFILLVRNVLYRQLRLFAARFIVCLFFSPLLGFTAAGFPPRCSARLSKQLLG